MNLITLKVGAKQTRLSTFSERFDVKRSPESTATMIDDQSSFKLEK